MLTEARRIAERLREAPEVHVYAHIDADGITGAAIAVESLERAGVPAQVSFLKKLDRAAIESVRAEDPPLAWFVDLGAGMIPEMEGMRAVITDHHAPEDVAPKARTDLVRLAEHLESVTMFNPHLVGRGSDAVSGAGSAYLAAKALDAGNTDLAAIAIVGAVADLQDREFRQLRGFNRQILEDGVEAGVLEATVDLRLFGRETRPVHKMLQYASDPWIPRLRGNPEACVTFLLELGLDLKVDDRWRSWSELDAGEKRRVVSELVTHMLTRGCPAADVERLVGEVYTLVREPVGSPLRDAKEFGTLMNACGRYDRPEVGMRVCRGDREDALSEALSLLRRHREGIVASLDYIADIGIEAMDHVQWFHARDRIRDTVVGIAAGMALGSPDSDPTRPMIAFADADDGVKVSARAAKELADRGLDLAAVMKLASKEVGGEGGGHKAAAGATIPRGTEGRFLEIANRLVAKQLGLG